MVYGEKDINTLKRSIAEDLTQLSTWLSNLNLHLNTQKTKFIAFKQNAFSRSVAYSPISLGADSIHHTLSYCYLGLNIDFDLKWINHIDMVASNISKYMYLLKKIRHSLNKTTLYMFYHAFIFSRLISMLPIWGNAAKTHLLCLQYLQNKALKFINFLPHRTPTVTILFYHSFHSTTLHL